MTVSNNIIRVSKYGMLWNSSRKNPMKHKDSHMLNYKSAIPIDSDRTLDALNSISCDLRIDIIVNYDYLYLIILINYSVDRFTNARKTFFIRPML